MNGRLADAPPAGSGSLQPWLAEPLQDLTADTPPPDDVTVPALGLRQVGGASPSE